MSKKNQHTGQTQLPVKSGHLRDIAFMLKIGKWKDYFAELHYKLLIAKALNQCVESENLHITGYLIARRRVYLVLHINPHYADEMLKVFYNKLRELLRVHEEVLTAICPDDREPTHGMPPAALFLNPFSRYPLLNDDLIKLITGKKIKLPYYSPHLQRLKDYVQSSSFCSTIDYAGGMGPVIINSPKIKM